MFDSHDFFKQRFSAHLKELSRYLRYMFNGHLMIALFFFISAVAFYYQQWLIELPENFPVSLIVGGGLGLLVSYSPVRTLLKEPDLVFLIAAENKMDAYFRNALIYSFVIQLYVILLVAAAFGPLYFAAFPDRAGNVYLLTIGVVLIFKVGNLIANWWMLKVRGPGVRQADLTIRTLLNMTVFYFIINGDMLLAGVTTVLFTFVFLYDLNISSKNPGVVWDLLVEKDQVRMQSFYRIANMFADVPHLKKRFKRRQWLVSIVNKLPFTQNNTFDYLYRITFIRSSDYLGMYFRLVVLGGLFIYFIPNSWMKILFVILFLYLSCFQMMTLYHHHRTIMWLDLYPVNDTLRYNALLKFLFELTLLQTILYSLLFLVMQDYVGFVIALASGTAFTFLFINGYVRRKLV
ncbi:ABC-2 type transport system permease protein [Virgibacillus natechei]|uniref:ABC-2 type transport system permease protein n=1 Tax=Virgibacillus natechei TaxID=1216297 RepID=A0ABS4IDG7_9BACI|nr:ABC transporter permease [Virgibacillus natechei]MBP1968987.1 ABC-2 type transport system permease protein [Virgibacillus natechei]UZD14264.1 ABC transporter permease [Virgibacillus natechei]